MRKNQISRLLLIVALIGALAGGGVFLPRANSASVANGVPEALSGCIPKQQVAKVDLITSSKQGETTYYLLNAYQEGDSVPTDLLISLSSQNQCKQILYNPMGDVIPLSRFVPEGVAQTLTLARLKKGIDQSGGKDNFQRALDRAASSQQLSFSPAEVWALKKLGIELPENIKVVDPKSIKVSPAPGQGD